MDGNVFVAILVLTALISTWNAYSSGRYWTESKAIGGFIRFIVWCGLIMSACGFTWVYLTGITIWAVLSHHLSPADGMIMFKLGYLVVLLPILGSGFGIWAYSLAQAFRRRTFGSVALAGYNTFAQAHNLFEASRQAPGAFKEVAGLFKSKDGAKIMLILALVALSVGLGIITTILIARWADKRVVLSLDPEPASGDDLAYPRLVDQSRRS